MVPQKNRSETDGEKMLILPPPDSPLENIAIAPRLSRENAWELALRWLHRSDQLRREADIAPKERVEALGNIPALITAIATDASDSRGVGAELTRPVPTRRSEATTRYTSVPMPPPAVAQAAADHAQARRRSGFSLRTTLQELAVLRTVLSESCKGLPEATATRMHSHLDAVIVEMVDAFVCDEHRSLRFRAERDAMTGLLNATAFRERLDAELGRARRHGNQLATILIDLDGFKEVNDTQGHATGDAVLTKFAEVLQAQMRTEDLAGRLGGDEFAVALTETDEHGAADFVRRVRLHLAPVVRQMKLGSSFGLSAGIACYPTSGTSPEALMHAADTRMYAMKKARKKEIGNAPVESGSPPKVLVVDDDKGVQAFVKAALEGDGFDVVVAGDAESGAAAFDSSHPDIVVADIRMPGRDGWRLVSHINSSALETRPPVVMLTGRSSDDMITRAGFTGAAGFLEKPVDARVLIKTVRSALSSFVRR